MAGELALAIWTTTPWTIPANAAVAVNADLDYAVAEVSEPKAGGRKYVVVAKDLVESLQVSRLTRRGCSCSRACSRFEGGAALLSPKATAFPP